MRSDAVDNKIVVCIRFCSRVHGERAVAKKIDLLSDRVGTFGHYIWDGKPTESGK